MDNLSQAARIKEIESHWHKPMGELLYSWHWKENLMHKEIAARLDVPRPTVTRWFGYFGVPSQSRTRLTNLNLLNVGARKSPPAKSKIKKPRPWKVNENFFEKWTPEMAYVLGFFCADGYMFKNPRGSCFVAFNITDKDLLEKIANYLGAGHKLSIRKYPEKNWKPAWRIQIGSKVIFNKLLSFGVTEKKSYRIKMPDIPKEYIADFIRGYFDGDGNVQFGLYARQNRVGKSPILLTRFVSCSRGILENIANQLYKNAGMRIKRVYSDANVWRLDYSAKDSIKFYNYIYKKDTNIFLERKKQIFEKYLSTYGLVA